MNQSLTISKDEISSYCKRNHISKLAIFGSALRDDFNPDSDVDVLVEFLPGFTPGFFGIVEMQDQLSAIFAGREVDLRTPEDLSRYFRDEVIETAEVQYAHKQ